MGTVRYNYYCDVFKAVPMPFAFVDLDTKEVLGKFWVEGGHFREEQKRR